MVTQKKLKVVLDTNIIVSALLFHGELSGLVRLWKNGTFIPVVSKDTFDEFRAVLHYPKFSLTAPEIDALLKEEILPYIKVVDLTATITGICSDPHDDKFLSCAVSASADYIVTGDRQFRSLKEFQAIKIVTPAEFMRILENMQL